MAGHTCHHKPGSRLQRINGSGLEVLADATPLEKFSAPEARTFARAGGCAERTLDQCYCGRVQVAWSFGVQTSFSEWVDGL